MKKSLAKIYEGITCLRKKSYDNKWLKTTALEKPVIVVGNITVGGTGKTPFVDFLIKQLQAQGCSPGVISRGYKGSYSGIVKVLTQTEKAADLFGDEPVLIAKRNPNVPVYLGKKRALAGQKLIKENQKVDIVVSDDGFQHFALHRDLNIVLIDCTESLSNYQLMPKGRLRESLSGLQRAQLIVFTKANWVSQAQLNRVRDFIDSAHLKGLKGSLTANYNLILPKNVSGSVVLLSSIARPKNFYDSVQKEGGVEVQDHIIFPDHHKYSQSDFIKIRSSLKKNKCKTVVTTEKDWVKLKEFKQIDINFKVAQLEVHLTDGYKKLQNELDQLLSKKNH